MSAQGIKKSNFAAQTSVPSGATFDYVSNATNYKITFANLVSSLGVTGTIVQDGDPTGVAVLDTQGSVNNIRNIEVGAGLLGSVSAQNGISLASGVQQDGTGDVTLYDDVSLSQPTLASLRAVNGATVTKTGDRIDIGTTNGIANRIIVTQASDLSGTLDGTKEYFIDGIVDMGSQSIEVPAGGLSLAGLDFDTSKLISSVGAYTMFTSPIGGSGNVLMKDIAIEVTGAGSQVHNLVSDTGFEAYEIARVNFNNCTSLGTIDNYRQGLETGTGRFGGTPELTLSGTWLGGWFIDTSIVRSLDSGFSGALYKEGTSFSMQSRFRSNQNIDLSALASFLDFVPANFPNPSTLQLDGCIVSRAGVFDATDANLTPGIEQSDLASAWNGNKGLKNTFEGGTLTVSSASATAIASTSTFYDASGTWTPTDLQHFDEPSNGQLRHLGDNPREFRVVASLSIEGPANDDVAVKVRKWDDSASGFVDVYTMTRGIFDLVGGVNKGYWDFNIGIELDQNDYVILQVANNSTTGNLTVEADSFFTVMER
jgi:hypothetical protein